MNNFYTLLFALWPGCLLFAFPILSVSALLIFVVRIEKEVYKYLR